MRGKTISNSWRNPTADYRKDPIANIYIQESIEWFSVSDGSQMNFLEQFKNLKHFMGLFDPNIEKGSRINEQNTLRKKKKQNKKSTVRVQFLLKPFLFLHTMLYTTRDLNLLWQQQQERSLLYWTYTHMTSINCVMWTPMRPQHTLPPCVSPSKPDEAGPWDTGGMSEWCWQDFFFKW